MEGFETETHDPAYLMVPQPLPDCYEASAITGSYNPLLPDLPLSLAMMEATDPRIVIFRREDISDHQFGTLWVENPPACLLVTRFVLLPDTDLLSVTQL